MQLFLYLNLKDLLFQWMIVILLVVNMKSLLRKECDQHRVFECRNLSYRDRKFHLVLPKRFFWSRMKSFLSILSQMVKSIGQISTSRMELVRPSDLIWLSILETFWKHRPKSFLYLNTRFEVPPESVGAQYHVHLIVWTVVVSFNYVWWREAGMDIYRKIKLA